ncbi:senescence-associated carboxylesterase 101-like [Macadamia integrifolia]|uniref:senescence-associated carboxylesterase 101-like n=1 Tax=Macadamia integrifolia TaxID=60698 RepID=UPI001C52EB17|nr:senescence-associated carboxylesterase 101-like [Macadamia integrifolia]
MSTLFSSGLELAQLVVASDLLRCSWEAIDELHKNPRSSNIVSSQLSSFSVKYETYQQPNYEILAFAFCSSPSSAGLEKQQQQKQVNPYLSINIAARALYRSLPDDLFEKLQKCSRPLIVTGNSLGGLVASHVVLEILQRFSSSKTNLPLCITFGSPIVSGNNGLRQVIYDKPILNSQFLHVVSSEDHIPFLFIPSNYSPNIVSNSSSAFHSKGYKTFGTYLMCSTSGCACFNSTDASLKLLEAKGRSQLVKHNVDYGNILGHLKEFNFLRLEEYGKILEDIKKSIIFSNGFSSVLPGLPDCSSLEVGIRLQMEAIEVTEVVEEYYNEHGTLMAEIEKQATEDMERRCEELVHEQKLSCIKINMAKLEWYHKVSWTILREGYYDDYKNKASKRSLDARLFEKLLTEYWQKKVEEAKRIPQKGGGVPLEIVYLGAGTNYRRMVEPLEIAEFYRMGKKKYLKHRPNHYKLLQKWLDDDEKNSNSLSSMMMMRNRKNLTLTEDSCFWAHVEDAMISIQMLKNGNKLTGESPEEDLKEFEGYVMGLIENLKVSPEIFLEKSTFMSWWTEYSKIIEDGHTSPLINYMKAKKYLMYK